jgi:large subunit ribosomal protein L25
MAEITLQAQTGRPTGSRASGRLRAEGKVPATVYGLAKDPQSVSVVWRELRAALVTDAGLNALIDLHVDGAKGDLVIVKDLQRHPVRRDVLHVDFLRVDADVAIAVDVPIVLAGEAAAVLASDGVIDQALHHLGVMAKPGDIPNEIVVDISGMEVGDVIRIGDLQLPSSVTTESDPEDAVVTASIQQVDLGEEPEGEEAEEGAEGEEAEGDGEAGGAEGGGEAGGGEGAAEGDAE